MKKAITLNRRIGAMQMKAKLHFKIFGRNMNERDLAVLDSLFYLSMTKKPKGQKTLFLGVKTNDFVLKVALAIDKVPSVARKAIEHSEIDNFIVRRREHKTNAWRYKFKDDYEQKYMQFVEMELAISDVIKAQERCPENPEAGRGLVPDDIYVNYLYAIRKSANTKETQ